MWETFSFAFQLGGFLQLLIPVFYSSIVEFNIFIFISSANWHRIKFALWLQPLVFWALSYSWQIIQLYCWGECKHLLLARYQGEPLNRGLFQFGFRLPYNRAHMSSTDTKFLQFHAFHRIYLVTSIFWRFRKEYPRCCSSQSFCEPSLKITSDSQVYYRLKIGIFSRGLWSEKGAV